jgi:hypothetical protein
VSDGNAAEEWEDDGVVGEGGWKMRDEGQKTKEAHCEDCMLVLFFSKDASCNNKMHGFF